MAKRKRPYSISTASLFPLSWGPGGLWRATALARNWGVGLQALPFWGIRVGSPRSSPITSLEEAWHPRSGQLLSLPGAVWRTLRPAKTRFPRLKDLVLFGPGHQARLKWMMRQNPAAVLVRHAPPAKWLELKPGLGKYLPNGHGSMLQWLLGNATEIPNLVADTFHLRRKSPEGKPRVFGDDYMFSVEELVDAGRVRMIHFQPLRGDYGIGGDPELELFLRGHPTELEALLCILRGAGEVVPVVIEVFPNAVRRYGFNRILRRVQEVLD